MMDVKQRGLAEMVETFFDKKIAGGAATLANESAVKNENVSRKELAKKLQKLIIRIFWKWKAHKHFIRKIWDADLAN